MTPGLKGLTDVLIESLKSKIVFESGQVLFLLDGFSLAENSCLRIYNVAISTENKQKNTLGKIKYARDLSFMGEKRRLCLCFLVPVSISNSSATP